MAQQTEPIGGRRQVPYRAKHRPPGARYENGQGQEEGQEVGRKNPEEGEEEGAGETEDRGATGEERKEGTGKTREGEEG